ncbi:hypothetical protein MHH81_16070 [Psychrobacillus sp. FSL H8-0484]|uniref:YncE family protein n=1 Tax=Psychrobacillus sp. FSL H8-0484 TaxID=2921390 RepID=UPI0030FAF725
MGKLKVMLLLFLLGGCEQTSFESIDPSIPFVASLNTVDRTIDFISTEQKIIQTWELDAAYTGFTLVTNDLLLVYGYTLEEANLIQLSTGKSIATLKVEEGTTYAYAYNENIYIANGKENSVTLFNKNGKKLAESPAGNYPMSMISDGEKLYVVNFKDEILSVFSLDLTEVAEWGIPSSSHGLLINDSELWLGGHGAGSSPNRVISRFNLETGEQIGEVEAPIMPINMVKALNGSIFAVSHGNSSVYEISKKGEILSSIKVGANPFSIVAFENSVVLAGYDDQVIYFIESGKVTNKVQVGKGPFQLIVREASN